VLLTIVGADTLGGGAGKPDFNGGDVVTVEAEVVAEVDGVGNCGDLSQSVKVREWLEAGTIPTVGGGGWGGNNKDEAEEDDADDVSDGGGNKSVESNRPLLSMLASIKIDSCSVTEEEKEEEEKSAFAIEEEDELVSLSHFNVVSFAFTSNSLSLFRLSDILLLFDRVCLPAPGPLKSISAL
jgi:hypothetical protein